ncbi:hypothetical protein A5819_002240 [Enterococcus sp. 7E2_DIV0204]|uniref:Histidinol-phosphatase n=1 Tax=Candidatus Enterococcus lemimoniae TaxID=1834167 RepID=A0ABZ2T5K2_9ENTE|nr:MULTISPECIES: PHP domain-containing protein [unclassified Enterococcus]OTN89742.1 hypothetical protein A5819_002240 [Enterococcus sp. 7E2_DIV0204]OTO68614.1 hypothetical protein A5866_000812 [Enterococcus sp. 12C11_DIV0727]OTP52203.1 hypothetical protein A5884_001404 [Enterococcus sp. 7D2_DIV0200]
MNYYDQHLHTHHSFDSNESFENYLDRFCPTIFVSTEHLDFKNPYVNGEDSIPEYSAYKKELNHLHSRYDTKLLRGIEVGYVDTHKEMIEHFLASNHYDIILLSIHQNGTIDYMDESVKDLDVADLIDDYYSRMLDAVQSVEFANVLTHFDYGVRLLQLSVDEFKKMAEPYLIDIFKIMIDKRIAFELNAKSFIKYENKALYEYAIPLYISLGGTLFTLGSDAHVAQDYELGFEEMKNLLRKNDVTLLALYDNQQLTLVPIS